MFLSLYCKGSKRVTQGWPVRGSWRPNRNCNILTPTLMAVNVVSLSFSRCSTGGPEAHSAGWWLSLLHLISNFSDPQTPSGLPRAPSAGCGFPYHISSITPSQTVTGTVLTELYNSSTPTRSPTRSLKSHVWSSSSGNNCHAVHRSLSSGASVYECTMVIFYLVPFHQPISAHMVSSHNCYQNVSLPSGASPWNGIFGRVEGQNITNGVAFVFCICICTFGLISLWL